jgi:hypothetical protein
MDDKPNKANKKYLAFFFKGKTVRTRTITCRDYQWAKVRAVTISESVLPGCSIHVKRL